MELNYPHNDINKLLKFSKKLQLQNSKKKLPKVIIIFNDKKFIKKKFQLLKIPKGSAILFRSYNTIDRKKIAKELLKFCRMNGLKLLISSDIKMAREINADGIHLPEYMIYNQTKINWKNFKILKNKFKWFVTVAAHNKKTLYKATQNNIDAAILSPIFPTKSHKNTPGLGITKLIKWTQETKIPVYALGGINLKNIQYLKKSGIIGFAFQRGY